MSGAWAALVGLVLKLAAALGIYRAGKKSEQAKQNSQTLDIIKEHKADEDRIRNLPDGALDEFLRDHRKRPDR
jgi:hypothetical protein